MLVIGCGTSYYVGDAYAYLRNDAGLGRTRAAIPTELTWMDDDEHIVVISRSGTTADVVEIVEQLHATRTASPRSSATSTRRSASSATASCTSASPMRRRSCRRGSPRRCSRRFACVDRPGADCARATTRATRSTCPLPAVPTGARQAGRCSSAIAGRVGLAHEAALKLRESAGTWTEAYPVWEYQHGPISCASPDSLVWSLDPLPEAVAADVRATGATVYVDDLDPQADLVLAHRLAVALAREADATPTRRRSSTVRC